MMVISRLIWSIMPSFHSFALSRICTCGARIAVRGHCCWPLMQDGITVKDASKLSAQHLGEQLLTGELAQSGHCTCTHGMAYFFCPTGMW